MLVSPAVARMIASLLQEAIFPDSPAASRNDQGRGRLRDMAHRRRKPKPRNGLDL